MVNELYHHGIKGQHWGVRRYQNPDGSLTPAGYQHYGKHPEQQTAAIKEQMKKYDQNRKSISVKSKSFGRTKLVDENGQSLKKKEIKRLEKEMKQDYKANDRDKYKQYKRARKDAGMLYISTNTSILSMAVAGMTTRTAKSGRNLVNNMLAEYNNEKKRKAS